MATTIDLMEYATDGAAQAAYVTNGTPDSYVKLLCRGEGADTGTTFTDDSQAGRSLTAGTGCTTSATQKHFGNTSIKVTAAGAVTAADHADWEVGSTWTVDFWVYSNATGSQGYFGQAVNANSGWGFRSNIAGNKLVLEVDYPTTWSVTWDNFIATGGWHHVAIVCNSNVVKAYYDGTEQTIIGTAGSVGAIGDYAAPFMIGGSFVGSAGASYADAYLDEFRVSKGVARWTSNFTPPTHIYDFYTLSDYSESTIKTQGSYSLKGVATTDALNKTLTRTISSPVDLSGVDTLCFDIYSSRTGSNIKIGIHDSGGTTTEITHSITDADTWETVVWDISAVADANKDAIDSIIVTITNADSANTFYIDNFMSAENVTVTAEPFIVTTSLSSEGTVILAGFGYIYEEDSSGAVMDVAVRTKTNVGKSILKRKALKYIYHMMNTHGKDVTMTVYVDGTAQTPTFTINTTVRKMTRIEDLPSFEGYKFDIRLTCNDLTDDDLEIYSPLALQYVPYGE